MNWIVIILVGIAAITLLVFLIIKNQKDEKEFEKKVNNDYPKPRDEKGDTEIDELSKNVR